MREIMLQKTLSDDGQTKTFRHEYPQYSINFTKWTMHIDISQMEEITLRIIPTVMYPRCFVKCISGVCTNNFMVVSKI